MYQSFTVALCASAVSAAQVAAPVPPADEAQLRSRIDQFYKLVIAQKYREAEELVAPESRDLWYSAEKPVILDYKISDIKWLEGGSAADIYQTARTKVRRPAIGEFIVSMTSMSHWIRHDGQWFWYMPKLTARPSSFGMMHVNPEAAAKSGLDLKEMIRKGPDESKLAEGVKVDSPALELGKKQGSKVVTIVRNTLPGAVRLTIRSGALPPGIAVSLSTHELAPGDRAELTIVRKKAGVGAETPVEIDVEPTQQRLVVKVR